MFFGPVHSNFHLEDLSELFLFRSKKEIFNTFLTK